MYCHAWCQHKITCRQQIVSMPLAGCANYLIPVQKNRTSRQSFHVVCAPQTPDFRLECCCLYGTRISTLGGLPDCLLWLFPEQAFSALRFKTMTQRVIWCWNTKAMTGLNTIVKYSVCTKPQWTCNLENHYKVMHTNGNPNHSGNLKKILKRH